MLRRILLIVLLVLTGGYAGDYVALRYKMAKNLEAFGSVPIQRYYAVTQKNGKPEFYFDPPAVQACVHSLFPHFGYTPCWYLNRNKVQRVQM